jgi:hypothetical protein
MKRPMIDTMLKEKFDNLYTPEEAVFPLLKHIRKMFYKPLVIWECCDPGESNITRVLKNAGYYINSSDILTGTDFLTKELNNLYFDMIVTNPPYSLKDKFLEKCYAYQKPFALLLPLTALEGKKRGDMYRKYGISVIVLDKRLDFTGKGANWFATAWFTWGILPENSLVFERLD